MANYQHLIDIIFQSKNAGKTQADIEKVFKSMDRGSKDVSVATGKMGDFEKALRRVAIVAPVWMVARGAMMSFLRGFSEGFKYLEDFNAAMLKAQAVTHGVTGSMGEAMTDLGNRIRSLSQETGESMTKIANAFYQFGTIGLNFETSWKGAEAATRFALATQEDSAKIAKTLAMTYKILGDTIDKTIPSDQAMEVELAKMYKLWQLNAGEAGDLTASLAAFLPTANTMNLTMDETIALLSTLNSAAMLGSRGGTLLRTSFSKLIDNADKLASSLGIYVNPQLDSTFDVMMKVLDATKQLYEAQKLPVAAQDVISGIFGGVRGGEPVRALVALYDQLHENLNIVGKDYQDLGDILTEYNKRQEDVIKSPSGQLKIFRELRTQIFETFLTGFTGANDFGMALERINQTMKGTVIAAEHLGRFLATPFRMPKTEVTAKKPEIISYIDPEVQKLLDEINQIETNEKAIVQEKEKIAKQSEEESILNQQLLRKLQLQKKELQEQLNIQLLQNEGYSKTDISIAKIANEVSKIVNQYNSLDAIQKKIVPQLNEQEVLSNVLAENWEKILQLTNRQPFVLEKILDLAKQVSQIESQRITDVELLIDHELELLKLRGAGSRELLEAEIALKTQVYGEKAIKNSLEYKLALEKQITKEKLNQNELSNDTLILYKIYKEKGLNEAKEISKYLMGEIPYYQLKEMPRIFETFKEYFPQKEEMMQTKEFLGLLPEYHRQYAPMTYPGYEVPTIEREAIKKIPTIADLTKQLGISPITMATDIGNINVTINQELPTGIKKGELASKIQIDIADKIRTDPEVKKAIAEQIEDF